MNDNQYIDWVALSDFALAQTIGAFIKHHRLAQNKTQEDIASAASISRSTLSLLENGQAITMPTFLQVIRVLDLLYVMDVFKIQEQLSPIKLAKLDQQKRQRARNKDSDNSKKTDW